MILTFSAFSGIQLIRILTYHYRDTRREHHHHYHTPVKTTLMRCLEIERGRERKRKRQDQEEGRRQGVYKSQALVPIRSVNRF